MAEENHELMPQEFKPFLVYARHLTQLYINLHINETIKKASKRLYFLRQLKCARVSTSDLVRFYTCCIRSVCDYAVPVFHSSLITLLMI